LYIFITLLSIIITALIGIFYPFSLTWIIGFSIVGIFYYLFKYKTEGFKPQGKTYKALEKIKKKREKTDQHKHIHINDQIDYIATYWGYTKEQKKIIEKFVEKRAYSEIYNKLTASLIPQIIALIDNCNARGQKGCKRDVSRRIRELTLIMKEELKKKRSQNSESFETTLEVYDHLVKELKY
jgi:uncharacterized protein YjgD (DUF1641 family)